MRRALAFLLAALFSFELIGPAVFANASPELPACCRRNGKHHCAMADTDGSAVKTLQPACPFSPKIDVVPGDSKILVPGVAAISGVPNALGFAVAATDDHRSLVALSGPERKRGPPPSFA